MGTRNNYFLGCCFAVVASLLSLPAVAAEPAPARTSITPLQWLAYCATTDAPVDLCKPHSVQDVDMSEDVFRLVALTWSAAKSNLVLIREADWEQGNPDRWRWPSDGRADCEDAALWIIGHLVMGGIPRGAVSLDAVPDWGGGAHMIAVLHTTEGQLEIDINSRHMRRDMIGEKRPSVLSQKRGTPAYWVTGG